MTTRRAACVALLLGVAVIDLPASGQAGIYGIVERVVLEPANRAPERVQVWGAFALIEVLPSPQTTGKAGGHGHAFTNYVYQQPRRGYLYFRLPPAIADVANARREWADLASVAGTSQAVAFGYYDRDRGDALMKIRDVAAKVENPDPYYTDIGVVKLSAAGSHASIVAGLRAVLVK